MAYPFPSVPSGGPYPDIFPVRTNGHPTDQTIVSLGQENLNLVNRQQPVPLALKRPKFKKVSVVIPSSHVQAQDDAPAPVPQVPSPQIQGLLLGDAEIFLRGWKNVELSKTGSEYDALKPIKTYSEDSRVGVNGSYWISVGNRPAFLFKPVDEEIGAPNCPNPEMRSRGMHIQAKCGVDVGTQASRECVGYYLGRKVGANVPPTCMMTLASPEFNGRNLKRGSAQAFVPNAKNLYASGSEAIAKIDPKELQRLFLFDLISMNADRNRGNILLTENGQLVLIDQGCIAPDNFLDSAHFCWMAWKREELHQPFDPETLEAIRSLDADKMEEEILAAFPDYPKKSLATLKYSLMIVKICAARGLTPFQIAMFFIDNDKEKDISCSAARALLEHAQTFPTPDPAFQAVVDELADRIAAHPFKDPRSFQEIDSFIFNEGKRVMAEMLPSSPSS